MNEWTAAELAILREHAGKKCAREIAAIVGRPRFATLTKLRQLGLPGFPPGRVCTLTPEQMDALRNVPPGISGQQFAQMHGVGEEAVRHWVRKLGITLTPASRWTEKQNQQLRDLAPTHTATQIAALIGRSRSSVWSKAHVLGVEPVREGLRPPKRLARAPKPPKAAPGPKLCRPRKAAASTPRKTKAAPAKAAVPIRKPTPPQLEYCPTCHAPVSNWQEHYKRMGHRRPAA